MIFVLVIKSIWSLLYKTIFPYYVQIESRTFLDSSGGNHQALFWHLFLNEMKFCWFEVYFPSKYTFIPKFLNPQVKPKMSIYWNYGNESLLENNDFRLIVILWPHSSRMMSFFFEVRLCSTDDLSIAQLISEILWK